MKLPTDEQLNRSWPFPAISDGFAINTFNQQRCWHPLACSREPRNWFSCQSAVGETICLPFILHDTSSSIAPEGASPGSCFKSLQEIYSKASKAPWRKNNSIGTNVQRQHISGLVMFRARFIHDPRLSRVLHHRHRRNESRTWIFLVKFG